ncbi:hypothetical protein IPH25_05065 [bacterium]|nr:MAG: hypothetical protein IPH25_05065 [bacterium]
MVIKNLFAKQSKIFCFLTVSLLSGSRNASCFTFSKIPQTLFGIPKQCGAYLIKNTYPSDFVLCVLAIDVLSKLRQLQTQPLEHFDYDEMGASQVGNNPQLKQRQLKARLKRYMLTLFVSHLFLHTKKAIGTK